VMFDCLDEFAAFGDHADLSDEEGELARGADLVVAVSEPLRQKMAALGARCVLVRNGCDPEHFGPAGAGARLSGAPVVGFFGGMHDWFDGDLVAALARARPQWEIWLVGDTYRGEVAALRTLPKVFFLGELPYEELPRVISHFDVGIIPFRISPLTEVVETVKVYEMLAAGLPVVASDLPELRRLAPLVAVAGSAEEFVRRIEEALAEPFAARAVRRDFARANSWLARFLEVREAMDTALGGAVVGGERLPPDRGSLGLAERRPI
jgi:glycosyltransferase involved in cell wall biosynthesis